MQAILKYQPQRTHFSAQDFVRQMWQLTPDEPIEFSHDGWDEQLNVDHSWHVNPFIPDYERLVPNGGFEALSEVDSRVGVEPFKQPYRLWLATQYQAEALVTVRAYVVMVDLLMQQLPGTISLDLGKTWISREEFLAPYATILTLNRAEIHRITALQTLSISHDDEIDPPFPLRW
ncbi:hypothetical protein [Lactiplantibacillus xiangfangensis]|uniref:Uncharacterized protein n=1 Tax=Lactiplantibacillus xiangfangensis TaxID=942150 RepID=A0A0R2MBG4_9LACO|nr:hypothetical protein [Lactiplantibacillus xiangfangensis]KRO10998.1 hypothetical protein IV64_GL002694 [Lactiplantibacillus xiangfangensis]